MAEFQKTAFHVDRKQNRSAATHQAFSQQIISNLKGAVSAEALRYLIYHFECVCKAFQAVRLFEQIVFDYISYPTQLPNWAAFLSLHIWLPNWAVLYCPVAQLGNRELCLVAYLGSSLSSSCLTRQQCISSVQRLCNRLLRYATMTMICCFHSIFCFEVLLKAKG